MSEIHRRKHPTFLLKAHGDVKRQRTLVFGHQDYRRLIQENDAYRKVLSTLFEQHVVFSVGYGLDDPDVEYLFDELLSTMRSVPLRVFALVPKGRINAVFRDLWLRERKLRLLEYEPSDSHEEVDQFLKNLIAEVEIERGGTKRPDIIVDSDSNLPRAVVGLRKRLVELWNRLNARVVEPRDAYPIARERAMVMDEFIKQLLMEIPLPFPQEGVAIVARGGYGRGHLAPNSDIDITVLHSPEQTDEVEAWFGEFQIYIDGCANAVGIVARPIVNLISECVEHWSDLKSFVSFTFSRLVVGDLRLHSALRQAWRNFAKDVDIQGLLAEIRDVRLSKQIEVKQPTSLNVKTCAGGIVEFMIGDFLTEIFHIRGRTVTCSTRDLELDFAALFPFRERAYAQTKTLALLIQAGAQSLMSAEQWRTLLQSRQRIRGRLQELTKIGDTSQKGPRNETH